MQNRFDLFKEMFELSQNEKRGLTIFLQGQTIVGVVQEIIETDSIVVRSQMFSRAVVCVESIDAVAVS